MELDPTNDEVLLAIEELQRRPGRERELIETLRRRAKLQLGDDTRESLYREARQLADQSGDIALAEAVLREVLQQDETSGWALAELTTLREAASDHREVLELLLRRADLGAQGDEVRELRHKAAALARGEVADAERAVGIYEQLFEDDPSDTRASSALRELYAGRGDDDKLGRLLERLIDQAESSSERSALRLALADLNEGKFNSPDRAISLLRDVLYDDATHSDAVVRLSELLEKTQRDEELAELLSSQIEGARARGDLSAELTFQVRLGEIYDSRLGDRGRAIETYRTVLERDPAHRAALEALARLLRAEGKRDETAEVLSRLLELSTGDEAVRVALQLADEYGSLSRTADAQRALERGLSAERTNRELRTRLRQAYETAEDWEKLAELATEEADLTDEPTAKVAALRQAASLHAKRRGDHAKAAELLDRASQLKPDREILLALCDEYSASGRGKAAAEVLERIVESYGGKRTKDLAEIHRRLADAYLADGEKQRALEELDKAFRIEPGNVGVLKRLGEVALDAGDYKKAQQMFRALLLQKLEGNSPITKAEVFFYLGETHLKLDEKPKAIQMYERAVQQDAALDRAKSRLSELKG
jgi:tetratricopeptide (TPR) repeat protein